MQYEKNYCIYLRKSREDRELEKYDNVDTLDRHRKALLDYADKHNLDIGEIYEEVVSGETISERQEMQRLLTDVENNKWSGVLVMEVERLARGDTSDQGIVCKVFKYSSTKIITPVKTYDPNNEFDEEYFEFGLYMSRREYKTINRRLQRGRMASVTEGKYVGSIPPFGYDREKLDRDKGYTLVVNENEANVVKQIFNLFAYKNMSINNVAKELNGMQLKPRKSEFWSISSVKDILSNPVYIGKIRWNARKQVISTKNGQRVKHRPRNSDVILVDGLHQSIIDEETWNIVQTKRSKNTPPVKHNNKIQNPLVGLVYCAKCGKSMQRRPYTAKGKEPTLMCTNSKCDNISSQLSIVEDKIIQALRIWLMGYKFDYEQLQKDKNNVEVITKQKQLQQLGNNIAKEKNKQDKIYTSYEEGLYDKDEFTKRLNISKSNMEQLKSKFKILESEIKQYDISDSRNNIEIPKLENILDIYSLLETSEEKNILLKSILDKVTYLKTKKAIKKDSDATNFEIHIYPKILKM